MDTRGSVQETDRRSQEVKCLRQSLLLEHNLGMIQSRKGLCISSPDTLDQIIPCYQGLSRAVLSV